MKRIAIPVLLLLAASLLWASHFIDGALTVTGVVSFLTPLDISSNTDFDVATSGRLSYDGESLQARDLEPKECGITNPVTGLSNVCVFSWPYDFTVTRIACITDVPTSAVPIEFEERGFATAETTGTEVMGSDLTCDPDGAVDTTFDNAVIAANDLMSLQIGTPANGPTKLRVFVTGRYTP